MDVSDLSLRRLDERVSEKHAICLARSRSRSLSPSLTFLDQSSFSLNCVSCLFNLCHFPSPIFLLSLSFCFASLITLIPLIFPGGYIYRIRFIIQPLSWEVCRETLIHLISLSTQQPFLNPHIVVISHLKMKCKVELYSVVKGPTCSDRLLFVVGVLFLLRFYHRKTH